MSLLYFGFEFEIELVSEPRAKMSVSVSQCQCQQRGSAVGRDRSASTMVHDNVYCVLMYISVLYYSYLVPYLAIGYHRMDR